MLSMKCFPEKGCSLLSDIYVNCTKKTMEELIGLKSSRDISVFHTDWSEIIGVLMQMMGTG